MRPRTPGCDGPGTRECWFRCCGILVPNGSRSGRVPAWKCRAREGVCCPALVGTLLREEQWNRNLVPCAEQVLCCSCADHDRLRSIRGIPAPVFSCMRDRVAEFRVCVAAWQAGAAPRLSGALRGDSEVQCRTGAFWDNQGLTGASRVRGLLPSLTAQFSAAALLR